MTTITDLYDDDMEIEGSENRVYVTITEGGDCAGVALDPSQAVEAAEALLKVAGRSVVPVSTLKLASDVSFNEAVLRVACAHKRTVTFRYAKAKGDYIEARRFNPEKLVGEGDSLAAIGHDPDRDDMTRRFRLDRIKGEVAFA